MKLVLATRNQGKVRELTEMLKKLAVTSGQLPEKSPLVTGNYKLETGNLKKARVLGQNQYEVISLNAYPDAPEVIEDGETYMENAAKKASVIAQYTGYLTLADDAGLEVDALNGAPGINSKRWAGEDATDAIRIAKLLQALEGVTDRRARFVAAIAVVHPDGAPLTKNARHIFQISENRVLGQGVLGVCEGHIRHAPVGESGFGYDPVFVPDGYNQTFAELGEEIKNQMSHRAKALQQALALL
ncbi:non-canonical purine NTP pyrophosphatase [Candidatus Poribacteria bacterium]|nr:MAG: non-canonical purine NTP pyrophosphatase [Candidatus Poribacteria bacterium]